MVRLAQLLALSLKPGDIVALHGDLGAGKTTFARALIQAFASDQSTEVVSPTFSLVQTYDCERGSIEHFDLYRLKSAEEAEEIGLSDDGSHCIRIIEWPDRLAGGLSRDRLDVTFEDTAAGRSRTVVLTPNGSTGDRLNRLAQLHSFIERSGWADAQIAYLQGDASTRRYARLTRGRSTAGPRAA